MKLPDKIYDILKWVALVALDAIGVFYQALSLIWGLPYGDEILSTCASISLLIGTLIGISTRKYNKDNKGEE